MSDSKSGANNPMYGKVPANAFQSGANHPYAITISVYSSTDKTLIKTFSSQAAAAEWLNTSKVQVSRYVQSGKVWHNKYIFRKSS